MCHCERSNLSSYILHVFGYSNTSLIKKLGIKEGNTVLFINHPDNFLELLEDLPTITFVDNHAKDINYIHLFTKSKEVLAGIFPILKEMLAKSGMLWISWPKRTSKLTTDLSENDVMKIGLENGLVDVKVAAIDDIWSGLKFVWRVKDRR